MLIAAEACLIFGFICFSTNYFHLFQEEFIDQTLHEGRFDSFDEDFTPSEQRTGYRATKCEKLKRNLQVSRERISKQNLSIAEEKEVLQWVKVVAAMIVTQVGRMAKITSPIPIQRNCS